MLFSGVAVAWVTEPDLRGLETAVVRALWGATHLSRAKEIIFTVLSKGRRVSPVMHTRYERLLWLARVARRPGVTQVFTQAIWESGGRPPVMGPVGCVLRTVATLGWSPREGWWCWDVPGQEHPLHFVQEPLRQLQQRARDSLRCHSSHQLEARRPVTFGGLGDGADCQACRAAVRAASTELEKSLLRGIMAYAVTTSPLTPLRVGTTASARSPKPPTEQKLLKSAQIARPTPPHESPMESGPGNTFSAQNRKKEKKRKDA